MTFGSSKNKKEREWIEPAPITFDIVSHFDTYEKEKATTFQEKKRIALEIANREIKFWETQEHPKFKNQPYEIIKLEEDPLLVLPTKHDGWIVYFKVKKPPSIFAKLKIGQKIKV